MIFHFMTVSFSVEFPVPSRVGKQGLPVLNGLQRRMGNPISVECSGADDLHLLPE